MPTADHAAVPRRFRFTRRQAGATGLLALSLVAASAAWRGFDTGAANGIAASPVCRGSACSDRLDGAAAHAAAVLDAEVHAPPAQFIAAPAGQWFVPLAPGQPLVATLAGDGGSLVLPLRRVPRQADAAGGGDAHADGGWPVGSPGAVIAARLADADSPLQWRPDGSLRDAQDRTVRVGTAPALASLVFQPMPSSWTFRLAAEPALAAGSVVRVSWPESETAGSAGAPARPLSPLQGRVVAVRGRELTAEFPPADVQRHMVSRLALHAATGVPLWPLPLRLSAVAGSATAAAR